MQNEKRIKCLIFDLTNLNRGVQFCVLAFTVFLFHVIQGYFNELIFKLPGFKPYAMYLTLLQFGLYALLAFLESFVKSGFKCRKALKTK